MSKNIDSYALDIQNSVWIDANAGSGKTHLLTFRIIKMLLMGKRNILCLTFTNAAREEMFSRISQKLTNLASLSDEDLNLECKNIIGYFPHNNVLNNARILHNSFRSYVNIHTIHSFCISLLRDENLLGNFQILTENKDFLYKRSLISVLSSEKNEILKLDFSRLLKIFDDLFCNFHITNFQDSKAITDFFYSSLCDLYQFETTDLSEIDNEISGAVDLLTQNLELYINSYEPTESLQKFYNKLKASKSDLSEIFLTKTLSPRKKMIKKKDKLPEICLQLIFDIQQLLQKKKNAEFERSIISDTQELIELICKVSRHYFWLKGGKITYDEILYFFLLYTKDHERSGIIFALYGNVEHVLIDESQDNSFLQWEIIRKIAWDILSQHRDNTIFVVGDIKQSIYNFQGSKPEYFIKSRIQFTQYLNTLNKNIHYAQSQNSYRSSRLVLDFLDTLINSNDNLHKHLNNDTDVDIKHYAVHDKYGEINIYFPKKKDVLEDDFIRSLLLGYQDSSEYQTAKNVVDKILSYVDQKVDLSDIMILVRKRVSNFYRYLTHLLNCAKLPYSVDKIDSNNIVIKWVSLIAKFLLSPNDHSILISLLRFPPFCLSEEDIFKICNAKISVEKGILYTINSHYAENYTILSSWLYSRDESVFFILKRIFNIEMLNAIDDFFGFGSSNIIDSFLSQIREISDFTTLLNILPSLSFNIEYNNTKHSAIRLRTVHNAKGLQAPIIIFADKDSYDVNPLGSTLISQNNNIFLHSNDGWGGFLSDDDETLPIFRFIYQQKQILEKELYGEYLRCIYVALTRAESILNLFFWSSEKASSKQNESLCSILYDNKEKLCHYFNNKHNYALSCAENNFSIQYGDKFVSGDILVQKKTIDKGRLIELKFNPINETEDRQKSKINIASDRGKFIHMLFEHVMYINFDKQDAWIKNMLNQHIGSCLLKDDLSYLTYKIKLSVRLCKENFSGEEFSEIEFIDANNNIKRIDRFYIDKTRKLISILELKTGHYVRSSDYYQQAIGYVNILRNIYSDYNIIAYIFWFDYGFFEEIYKTNCGN
ncbi:UvrD-helicase domain-containing protein [Anaplasmataceae bacterium AB001_6]|nr:UvrD-helicase domain-containing protein [Anaplasmataceae bacterium AB001_6]